MNLVIDAGNTRTKVGIFEGATIREWQVFPIGTSPLDIISKTKFDHAILSSVSEHGDLLFNAIQPGVSKIRMSSKLLAPIKNLYATPETLGSDRLAAACGAWTLFPNESSLVIDIGTCINYEFVHQRGEYHGGAISPGLSLRFLSMHQYTSRLPMTEPTKEALLTGNNTITCLQSGVMNGVCEEINGIVTRYKHDHPGVRVILTGGDAHFFEKLAKPPIFVAPDLVLRGLNSILLHNVNP